MQRCSDVGRTNGVRLLLGVFVRSCDAEFDVGMQWCKCNAVQGGSACDVTLAITCLTCHRRLCRRCAVGELIACDDVFNDVILRNGVRRWRTFFYIYNEGFLCVQGTRLY